MTLRRWLLWFIACGIGGALLDQLHTQLGVLSYRTPLLFGQAWWVVPNFGVGGVVFLALGLAFVRRASIPMPSERDLWIGGAIFVGAYAASCFSFGHGWLMLIGFSAVWCFRVARRPLVFAIYSILIAIMGTSYELTATSTGIYFFHDPDVLTVPAWLPGLYLNGAPLGLSIARRIAG